MEKYSISQTPSGPSSKTPPKSKKAKVPKAGGRRSTQSLDPKMIALAAAAFVVLVLGGLAWAHFISNKNAKPDDGAAAAQQGSGGTGEISQETFQSVTSAIDNNNLSALKDKYAKQVRVVVVKTSTKRTVSPSDVEALIAGALNGAQGPWNWHVPASDISQWQQGPYGEYFTDDHTIGISEDGTVISIGYDNNGNIDEIFIAPVEDLAPPTSQGGSNGTPSDSGSNPDSGSPANPDNPSSVTPTYAD